MHTNDAGHVAEAVSALSAREYELAGDEYSRAAWRVLAEPRDGQSPFENDKRGYVGVGVQYLLTATICYRIAGCTSRATHRGLEGIAVARDLQNALSQPVQRACLDELVADCRVAGNFDGIAAAYETAVDAYRAAADSVDSPQAVATTPLFEAAATPIKQVARSLADGEIAITWEALHGPDPAAAGEFLAHRPRYKQQRFGSLLQRAIDEEFLAAPRGTTEYATDHHQCPDCGSTDVNWIADSVLCLRCSRPTEPV